MSLKVHQSAEDADATSNVAPLAVRRRTSARFTGLGASAKNDDFPILIRLPDLSKMAPLPLPIQDAPKESVTPAEPAPISKTPENSGELVGLNSDENSAENSGDDESLSPRERAKHRRRHAKLEPEPTSSSRWQGSTIQWAAALGIIVVASIGYHLMMGRTNGKKEAAKDRPAAKVDNLAPSPPKNDVPIEDRPSNEPTPAIPPPEPKLTVPHQSQEPVSDQNSERVKPRKNLEWPTPAGNGDSTDMTSRYPQTDPNNFRYKLNGDGTAYVPPPEISRPGDSQGREYGIGCIPENEPTRDESVRAAKIMGIKNLPPRERR